MLAGMIAVVVMLTAACGSSSKKATNTAAAGGATSAATSAATSPAGGATTSTGGGALPAGNADTGKQLYTSQTCVACHSVDGTKIVGPSWKGLYGSQVELEGGQTVTADDAYIKESILSPNAKVVKGYTPAMPPFTLTDQQIADIIAYMKTLQ